MVNKEGLAVNKKGLTFKELLHQSSHHNARTRKDALAGIKDLLIKHPTELRAYKPTIAKLRERIRDSDKNVREALYHLLKTVVLPWSKDYYIGLKRKISVSTGDLIGESRQKVVTEDVCSKSELHRVGRTINKTNKRSYAQLHLELGQPDFILHSCSICGLKYAPGDELDEDVHKTFHKNYTQGIQFKGWRNERVIQMPSLKEGRILFVTKNDPPAHRNKVHEVIKLMETELGCNWIFGKNCKVYIFICSQRIAGCLVSETIKEAFKVISCNVNRGIDKCSRKDKKLLATTFQFGEIIFQREIVRKVSSDKNSEMLEGNQGGAILCEEDSIPAVCGIRAIWVAPSCRRKHIATQLLDAMRKSFCKDYELEKSQIAFSQPTSAGKALASSYIGTGSFLVYKADSPDM